MKIKSFPDFIKYCSSYRIIIANKIIKYGDAKINALDKFLETSPALNKIDKMLTNIEYKIAHRHPIDSCDLDDLFYDKLSNHDPTILEMIKRKTKYCYKTVLYFLV